MKSFKVVLAGAFCFSLLSCATNPTNSGSTLAQSSQPTASTRKPAEQADFFEFTTGNCSATDKCSVVIPRGEKIRLFKAGNEFTGKMYEDGVSFHSPELNLDGVLFSRDGQLVGIKWSDDKIWGDISNGTPGFNNSAAYTGQWTFQFDVGHSGTFASTTYAVTLHKDGSCDGAGFTTCSWEAKDGHLVLRWGGTTKAVSNDKHDDFMAGTYYVNDADTGAFKAQRTGQ